MKDRNWAFPLEDLDRKFDELCDAIKAERFHIARSDFLREWRFLEILWNRLQEDYRIFNESQSRIREGSADKIRIGKVLRHGLECIHLDTNCFLLNASILVDRVAYLTSFFWEKIAKRQPEWCSFEHHKEWFKKSDKKSEILDEDYATYITQNTDWFEKELKDIRDKLIVHRPGSYIDVFKEESIGTTMLGKAEFRDKDGETIVEYDLKQIPDLNKLMNNICDFLDFFDKHFSQQLARKHKRDPQDKPFHEALANNIESKMAPFSWQRINEDWLKGVPIDYSPSLAVDAFNCVETFLGEEYFQRIRGRGVLVALPMIDLGLILKEVGPMKNADKLVERLGINDASALAEARLIAHYRRHNLQVAIEPELGFNGKKKHLDFRVKYGRTWIYVEVASPCESDERKKIDKAMWEIVKATERIERPRKIDIFLYRLPTGKEIPNITDVCLELAENEKQPCTHEMDKIGVIVSNILKKEEENLLLDPDSFATPTRLREIYRERPICYRKYLKIGGLPTHTLSSVHVRLPFTDKRAEKFIRREQKQLSPYEHNMIALDITHVTNVFKRSSPQDWRNLIQGRLQPRLNRRIGAVLLTRSEMNMGSVLTEKMIVEHPSPYKSLPDGFLKMSLNDNYSRRS